MSRDRASSIPGASGELASSRCCGDSGCARAAAAGLIAAIQSGAVKGPFWASNSALRGEKRGTMTGCTPARRDRA